MIYASNNKEIRRLIGVLEKYISETFDTHLETAMGLGDIEKLSHTVDRLLETVNDHVVKYKQTESARKTAEEKYRRLEGNIPGMVYLFAMHPDGSFSFPYVNGNSQVLFNIAPEDLMRDATLLTMFIHPDDRERFDKTVKKSAETLQPWRETIRHMINGSG